jgi:hypothetical protein
MKQRVRGCGCGTTACCLASARSSVQAAGRQAGRQAGRHAAQSRQLAGRQAGQLAPARRAAASCWWTHRSTACTAPHPAVQKRAVQLSVGYSNPRDRKVAHTPSRHQSCMQSQRAKQIANKRLPQHRAATRPTCIITSGKPSSSCCRAGECEGGGGGRIPATSSACNEALGGVRCQWTEK